MLNRYHWQEKPQSSFENAHKLASSLEIPEAGARFLISRSLDDENGARRYLSSGESFLNDPFLFTRMRDAVACMERAASRGEGILIHGDYDVDGICGTAVLYLYLRSIFPRTLRFLPDRRKDGYGLSGRAVRWALDNGVGLMVAVDCGTSDGPLVGELERAGVEVIICDHHEFPVDGEPAGILLNPVRDRYPFPHLCGAGVAFKLVQALESASIRGSVSAEELLDLVALATVGDMAPLVGENRYFVKKGLEEINVSPRPGLRALIDVSGVSGGEVDEECIAYRLAPRLNAPGRLSHARPALELLCTCEPSEAAGLAGKLEKENSKRRTLTEKVAEAAERMLEERGGIESRGAVVLADPAWDEGVLGIAAARLASSYGRPAVLIAVGPETAKGSGRSVPGVNLKEELDSCREYLSRYGGHEQAVGLALASSRVGEFVAALERRLAEAAGGLPEMPVLRVDAPISLAECSMEMLGFLAMCKPFGMGNEEPVWKLEGIFVGEKTAVVGNGHMKLFLRDGAGTEGEAIYFGGGGLVPELAGGGRFDVAVVMKKGFFSGRYYPEMRVVDMRRHIDGGG